MDRYPRESCTLATKLCAWMGARSEKSAKQRLYTSLERTAAVLLIAALTVSTSAAGCFL